MKVRRWMVWPLTVPMLVLAAGIVVVLRLMTPRK